VKLAKKIFICQIYKMKKKILIIGGSGFIGSKLIDFYLKKKFNVFSISLTLKKNKNIPNLKNFYFDISNKKKCTNFFNKYSFHYIINLAGYVDHRSFYTKNNNIIESHLLGTLNTVLNVNKSVLIKYLYIGSSDEYGSNTSPQNEIFREMPSSTYSFAKTSSTHFLQMISRAENFPSSIVRIFLTYGPGQKENRFIPQIIKGCLENSKFKTSSGKQLRDFCYIDDVVRAINMVLISKKSFGKIYNIGSNKPIQIKKVVKMIRSIIGKGVPVYGSFTLRKNENIKLFPSISKITKEIGWKPRLTLYEGLIKTINYLQKTR